MVSEDISIVLARFREAGLSYGTPSPVVFTYVSISLKGQRIWCSINLYTEINTLQQKCFSKIGYYFNYNDLLGAGQGPDSTLIYSGVNPQ